MAEITDVKIGQALPPERWNEAADHMEMVAPVVAQLLLPLSPVGTLLSSAPNNVGLSRCQKVEKEDVKRETL